MLIGRMNRRKWMLAAAALGLAGATIYGQQKESAKVHRAVIELTAEPAAQWEAVLNNAENAQRAFAPERVEVTVVVHGKALPMLLKANTAQFERMAKMASNGVTFAACRNSMRRMKVEKADLHDFATTVDSGVAEVIRKQEAGWAYVKGGG